MALKTKVKRENVVSEEDGNVQWITDTGKMMTLPAKDVQIIEPEAAPASTEETPDTESTPQNEETPDAEANPPTEKPAKPKKERAPPKAKQAAPAKPAKTAAPAPAAKAPENTKPQADKPAKPEKENTVAKAKKKSTAKGVRTIGGKEVDLSKYKKVKTAAGGTSYNIGDATATKLEGKTLDEIYKAAAAALKVPEKELRTKYGKLNPGMQRMSLGNRMRGGPKKEKAAKKSA